MSGDLSEDLMFEIFTRLPTKSLIRFRSLSKSLRSCISSPRFVRMHKNTFKSPQKVMITHYNEREYPKLYYTLHSENQLPYCPRRGYIGIKATEFPCNTGCRFVGSSNGIICVYDWESYRISLWNPSIRRKLTLPDCIAGRSSHLPWISILYDFDAKRAGFGFDPIKDDYKIVILPQCGVTGECSYLYAMKTGVWCEIASPTTLFRYVTSRGCFVNGVLHWACYIETNDKYFSIMTLNLSSHVFGNIVLPESSWETEQLTTIQGSLAVISRKHHDWWIWVMREYNNTASWTVVFKFETYQFQGRLQRVLQHMSNGDLLFDTNLERFQVYDPKIGAQSRLQNLDAGFFIYHIEMYVESLQLLNTGKVDKQSIIEEKKEDQKNLFSKMRCMLRELMSN